MEKHQYNDNKDQDYKGIRQIGKSFNEINEEDYCKPIKTKGALNYKNIEYESKEDKDRNLRRIIHRFS